MPSLGADMEAGRLLEWRVRPGDRVKRGDIVALVDTDKAEIEVEVWESGVVEALLVEPGVKVPVGTVLARIRGEGEAPVQPVPAAAAPPAPAAPAPLAQPAAVGRASPLARRLASQLGVDLAQLRGSGPGGAVTRDDVERAAAAASAPAAGAAPAAGDRRVALRRAIAAAMERANREIPHYYLATSIDMSRALAWLEAENARRPLSERLLVAALLLRAVALAVADVPEMNGTWEGGALRASAEVHLGVAVSLRGGGLVAPAIRSAHAKGVDALMRELRDLVRRARASGLRSSEMGTATLTVTNLGDAGADAVFGVIHPPQVALVGFGRVAERPWATGGRVEARPVVGASLSADHRASDGHRGALFLAAIDRRLQRPEAL